jgi:hypothetical protein
LLESRYGLPAAYELGLREICIEFSHLSPQRKCCIAT